MAGDGKSRTGRQRNCVADGGVPAADLPYEVPGEVPTIPQETHHKCWAAVVAMLYSWRDRQTYTMPEALELVGEKWVEHFQGNAGPNRDGGLLVEEQEQLVEDAGMEWAGGQSYGVADLLSLLQTYGPLWVTNPIPGQALSLVHSWVVTGIQGDGTISGTGVVGIDPYSAQQIEIRFDKLLRQFYRDLEGHEADESLGRMPIHVVHWPQGSR